MSPHLQVGPEPSGSLVALTFSRTEGSRIAIVIRFTGAKRRSP